MKKLLFILSLFLCANAYAQPSNYTNINGRYRWIAGAFDSTFHIPKGTSPSLRTGGWNSAGALYYKTTDSSVYTYTGTQWIKLRGYSPDTSGQFITSLYRKNASDSVFYVKGGSHSFAFRDSIGTGGGGGGGGKVYFFNGSINQGTFGGTTMYALGDTAITGSAANFTRSTTGNIANFITNSGEPNLLSIPGGVWNVEAYMSETGGGSNHAEIYAKLEVWNGSTLTVIASSPIEQIVAGSVPTLYDFNISVPTTTLALTDRIVIQFYIQNTNGKTVTLYTQNGYLAEVKTTFTTGIGALNGLTASSQFFATGTSGTDFNITSAVATHTFNIPTASGTNRGALSSSDWTTFNGKVGGSGTTNYVPKFTSSSAIGNSQIIDNGTAVGIGTAPSNSYKLSVAGQYRGIGVGDAQKIELIDSQSGGSTLFLSPQLSLGVNAIGSYGDYPLAFVVNNSEKMRLNSTGLGIGTSSPTTKLTIKDDNNSVGTNTTILVTSNNGVATTSYGWDNLNTNYDYSFKVSGSTKMYLANSGNVGIGTTSPSGKLHISTNASGAYLEQIIENTNSGGYARTLYKIGSAGASGIAGFSYAPSLFFKIGVQENDSSTPLTFVVNSGSEAMRISSGGNVLVGTSTDAGGKLQVNGQIRTSNAGIWFPAYSGGQHWEIGSDGVTGSGMYIYNSSGGYVLQLGEQGALISPFTYTNTTANSANIYMGSTGTFERSTSSIRYKTDVRNYDKGLAEIMQLRPVYYKGKNDGNKQFAGLIAEEVDSLGLKEFVQYDDLGRPDALSYQNMIALAFNAIKELKAEIETLKNK